MDAPIVMEKYFPLNRVRREAEVLFYLPPEVAVAITITISRSHLFISV